MEIAYFGAFASHLLVLGSKVTQVASCFPYDSFTIEICYLECGKGVALQCIHRLVFTAADPELVLEEGADGTKPLSKMLLLLKMLQWVSHISANKQKHDLSLEF